MRRFWKEHGGVLITAILFLIILCLTLSTLNGIRMQNAEKQSAQLRQSVYRAAAICYATEGFYPSSIDYLKDHYGLRWDASRYMIHYDCFASNILPVVQVLPRGDEAL